jgi:hypothetical protein
MDAKVKAIQEGTYAIAELNQKQYEDQKKWDEEQLKELQDQAQKEIDLYNDYKDYMLTAKQETRDAELDGIMNDWAREQEIIDEQYAFKMDQISREKEIMLAKLENVAGYEAEKARIEKQYADEALALEKKRNRSSKLLALDRAAYEIDVAAGMASSISAITDQLDEKNRAAKYGALVLESAASIAEIWVNYEVASAKGFAQMGPILGIPAAAAMQIAAGLATAAVVAKTATGLAAINSAGKEKGESAERNNKQYGGTFALGGPIVGASHASGGVNINAEGGEFVVNKRAMAVPQIANMVVSANAIGNGQNVGGLLTEERVAEIASAVVGAIPVYVVESEITGVQKRARVRESKFVI